jgi:hypothetical protein
MMNEFNVFMRNPLQYLLSKNINIPQQYANNPEGAVQYLMDSGKLSQEQFNYLMNQASQMGARF